jgi:hypothetical protein
LATLRFFALLRMTVHHLDEVLEADLHTEEVTHNVEILENRDLWSATFREGWLAHLERTGEIGWELYPLPDDVAPPAGPGCSP